MEAPWACTGQRLTDGVVGLPISFSPCIISHVKNNISRVIITLEGYLPITLSVI